MGKKHFGVESSTIEELMQFQLSLSSNPSMSFVGVIKLSVRPQDNLITQRITSSRQSIAIEGATLVVFTLPRQNAPRLSVERLLFEHQITEFFVATLNLSDWLTNIGFFFNTYNEREEFLKSLGDLHITPPEEAEENGD